MSEELKLLTAMCSALGLKVERKVVITNGMTMEPIIYSHTYGFGRKPSVNGWDFIPANGDAESYYQEIISTVEYNVTRDGE